MRLPKLERLLLDCDINLELEPLLQAIGFRTESALRVGVNHRNDTEILKWARRHRCILLCHDRYRDKETKIELYPEVYRNGGKIIQICGGPEQHPLTSLGKILAHREEWLMFFKENSGVVALTKDSMKKKRARDLYTMVQREFKLQTDPEESLRQRARQRKSGKRKVKLSPSDQVPLL